MTYCICQALVSTITSTVANQAILRGIGVGDESATLLAATITWIMKGNTDTDIVSILSNTSPV